MPLVSGVCRTASAPTLSHGGSRLNASKPEANPKTRCPRTKTPVLHFQRKVRRHAVKTRNVEQQKRLSNRHLKHCGLCLSRWRKVYQIITRNSTFSTESFSHTKRGWPNLVGRQQQTNYVPLQTREHAWAGMSGMLHFGGARGAFYVPRR